MIAAFASGRRPSAEQLSAEEAEAQPSRRLSGAGGSRSIVVVADAAVAVVVAIAVVFAGALAGCCWRLKGKTSSDDGVRRWPSNNWPSRWAP